MDHHSVHCKIVCSRDRQFAKEDSELRGAKNTSGKLRRPRQTDAAAKYAHL
jgi:hypothetical protein